MPIKELVIVGEAPVFSGRPAFWGRSGQFLATLAGVPEAELRRRARLVNLLRDPQPMSAGKGRLFDIVAASASAGRMGLKGKAVVLAGKRVALAFGLRGPPWLKNVIIGKGELRCFVVPHPSGIVRWWNSEENRRAASRLLRRLLAGAGPSGSGTRARSTGGRTGSTSGGSRRRRL